MYQGCFNRGQLALSSTRKEVVLSAKNQSENQTAFEHFSLITCYNKQFVRFSTLADI